MCRQNPTKIDVKPYQNANYKENELERSTELVAADGNETSPPG